MSSENKETILATAEFAATIQRFAATGVAVLLALIHLACVRAGIWEPVSTPTPTELNFVSSTNGSGSRSGDRTASTGRPGFPEGGPLIGLASVTGLGAIVVCILWGFARSNHRVAQRHRPQPPAVVDAATAARAGYCDCPSCGRRIVVSG